MDWPCGMECDILYDLAGDGNLGSLEAGTSNRAEASVTCFKGPRYLQYLSWKARWRCSDGWIEMDGGVTGLDPKSGSH